MAEEGFVTTRECETMHIALNQRLDSMDDNLRKIEVKLDVIAAIKGKVEFMDSKIDGIGKKFDRHVDDHGNFIKWSLAILALASTLVTVITFLLKR